MTDDGAGTTETCPSRRLPLPVRVLLRPSRRLEDGFLVGWRVEGRRVLAVVELASGERVEADPWDVFNP